MPTRPRIDLAGFHHVINRGVNRCDVFNNSNDKDMFLQIINKTATIHKVTLHDYCLMDNHYHLLIETQKENLATFMRIVSANYSQYFNKKMGRVPGRPPALIAYQTRRTRSQNTNVPQKGWLLRGIQVGA